MREVLRGRLDDGTLVEVWKITPDRPGYPGQTLLPSFQLADGTTLTQRQDDKDLTRFMTLRGVNVTIVR